MPYRQKASSFPGPSAFLVTAASGPLMLLLPWLKNNPLLTVVYSTIRTYVLGVICENMDIKSEITSG
jgi:hypothetical protein